MSPCVSLCRCIIYPSRTHPKHCSLILGFNSKESLYIILMQASNRMPWFNTYLIRDKIWFAQQLIITKKTPKYSIYIQTRLINKFSALKEIFWSLLKWKSWTFHATRVSINFLWRRSNENLMSYHANSMNM